MSGLPRPNGDPRQRFVPPYRHESGYPQQLYPPPEQRPFFQSHMRPPPHRGPCGPHAGSGPPPQMRPPPPPPIGIPPPQMGPPHLQMGPPPPLGDHGGSWNPPPAVEYRDRPGHLGELSRIPNHHSMPITAMPPVQRPQSMAGPPPSSLAPPGHSSLPPSFTSSQNIASQGGLLHTHGAPEPGQVPGNIPPPPQMFPSHAGPIDCTVPPPSVPQVMHNLQKGDVPNQVAQAASAPPNYRQSMPEQTAMDSYRMPITRPSAESTTGSAGDTVSENKDQMFLNSWLSKRGYKKSCHRRRKAHKCSLTVRQLLCL